MKKLLLMLSFFWAPVASFAQGSIVNDIAFKNLITGIAPAAGATVTVCTSAGTGIPCTPLATVYSDIALTVPLTNPLTADSNGYYSFYAVPGTYIVTITGAGTSGRSITYMLPLTLSANNAFTGNNTHSGTETFLNLNDILWVGPGTGSYNTIAAAQTAAGVVNKVIIGIRSTYAGVECPSGYTPNIIFWDFRGGAVVCGGNNWIGYGTKDASGVNALTRSVQTVQGTTLPVGGAVAGNYGQVYINSVNFNGSFADGGSNELDFFGAQSGTMPLASGAELDTIIMGTAQGSASTGGTITRAVGAQGYVTTFSGSTTAIGTVAGLEGLGCASANTLIQGVVPTNCYGLYGKSQLASAGGRNYSAGFEGLFLGLYDSAPNCSANCQNLAGLDLEDNAHATHHVLYNDSGNNTILQATTAGTGLLLEDSATTNHLRVKSTGVDIFTSIHPTSAGGAIIGTTALPVGTIQIGTAATNNFALTPAATAAARTINILDPGATTTLDLTSNTSTTPTQVLHASATAGVGTYAAIATADIATALTTPGPIGGTTPGTGAFTTLSSTGNFTPSQTNGIVGTTTNNNANAGSVGEYVQSVLATGSSVTLTSGVTSNVTSISLTAGDWDVTGAVDFTFGATTSYTNLIGSVSSTSATIGGQDSKFDFETPAAVPTAGADAVFSVPVVRFSLSGTTTVFLVAQGTFTVSTLKAYGTIRARRIR